MAAVVTTGGNESWFGVTPRFGVAFITFRVPGSIALASTSNTADSMGYSAEPDNVTIEACTSPRFKKFVPVGIKIDVVGRWIGVRELQDAQRVGQRRGRATGRLWPSH